MWRLCVCHPRGGETFKNNDSTSTFLLASAAAPSVSDAPPPHISSLARALAERG